MSEIPHLVTWDTTRNLGKVPDSDWTCPVGDVAMLSLYEMLGGEVDDAAIRRLADGRPQHLELLQYPEGYHSLQVVDSETGQIVHDRHASREYVDYSQYLEDCAMPRGYHPKPGTKFRVEPEAGQLINLDKGRRITYFAIFDSGARIAVYPRSNDPEYAVNSRPMGSMTLLPQEESIMLDLRGKAGSFEGEVKMSASELKGYGLTGTAIEGTILVTANDSKLKYETVIVRVNEYGQLASVEGHRDGQTFLRMLGADPSNADWDSFSGKCIVTDPEDRQRVAGGVAEILGLGPEWQDIDLRLTAAGLYAALGQPSADLNRIVVPRDGESTLVKS